MCQNILRVYSGQEELTRRTIEKAGGNKIKAAKLLEITRRELYSMLEKLE